MEMDRTIVRRVIRTLRSVEKGIPRFRIGHLGRCVRTHRSLDKDAPVSSGSAEWNHLFTADTRRTSFALRQASGFLDVGVSKVSQSAATRDLPLGPESITGFTIVSAGSLEDAENMARSNPFISSIRVYEVMSK